MANYKMQAPDGKTYQIAGPDGATPEQVRAEITKQNPHLAGGAPPATPAAPPQPPAAPVPAWQQTVRAATEAIPDPLTVAGKGLHALRIPIKAAFDLAGKADVASGIKTPEQAASRANTYANIPIPMVMGALTGGASLPAQAILQAGTTAAMQEGGLEPKSPGQVVASGVLPFGLAGLGRLARGIPRAATRLVPSWFKGAQQGAQAEAEKIAGALEGPQEAGALFQALKGAAPKPPVVLGPPKPLLALPARGQSTVTGPGHVYEQGQFPEIGQIITPTSTGTIPMTSSRSTLEEAAALMRGQPKPYVPMGVPPAQPNIVIETVANTAKPVSPPIGGPGFGVMRHGTLPQPAPPAPGKLTAEKIPAANLMRMLDDLEDSIPKDPTSGGLKTVRELMVQARGVISGDRVPLGELMKLRLDAGRSLKKAPEVAALYKGILGDLEQAGAAGGPGATLAMRALEAGRRQHGTELFRDLVEKASTRRSNLTGDLPLLDMAQLAKRVQENKDQLTKQLGPEGVSQIEDFLVKYRALPPVDAYNFANKMALGGLGTAGFFGGGPMGAVGAAGLYELLNNAKAVGANPAELNRALIMLGEGVRAGLGGMAESAVKAKQ